MKSGNFKQDVIWPRIGTWEEQCWGHHLTSWGQGKVFKKIQKIWHFLLFLFERRERNTGIHDTVKKQNLYHYINSFWKKRSQLSPCGFPCGQQGKGDEQQHPVTCAQQSYTSFWDRPEMILRDWLGVKHQRSSFWGTAEPSFSMDVDGTDTISSIIHRDDQHGLHIAVIGVIQDTYECAHTHMRICTHKRTHTRECTSTHMQNSY